MKKSIHKQLIKPLITIITCLIFSPQLISQANADVSVVETMQTLFKEWESINSVFWVNLPPGIPEIGVPLPFPLSYSSTPNTEPSSIDQSLSLMSYTGVGLPPTSTNTSSDTSSGTSADTSGNAGIGAEIKNTFSCLTQNVMPDKPMDINTILNNATFPLQKALEFTSDSKKCFNTFPSTSNILKLASAYKAVTFFKAATAQCLDTYGDPNASSKTTKSYSADSDPTMKTVLQKNMVSCDQRSTFELEKRIRNTLVNSDSDSDTGSIPMSILQNYGLISTSSTFHTDFTNKFAIPYQSNNVVSWTPGWKAGFQNDLTNIKNTLTALQPMLRQALMMALNQAATTAQGTTVSILENPIYLSIGNLVSQSAISAPNQDRVKSWVAAISDNYSPGHYMPPSFPFFDISAPDGNNNQYFGLAQGRLIDLKALGDIIIAAQTNTSETSANTLTKIKNLILQNTSGDGKYIAATDVHSYRQAQSSSIATSIRKYSKDMKQFSTVKNSAVGNIAMLIAERTPPTTGGRKSFIQKLKDSATARFATTGNNDYFDHLKTLVPVDVLREQVRLLAEIRYQLFLNYLAQERTQASLAVVQLGKLSDKITKLDSQYKSIQDNINKYVAGGVGSSTLSAPASP